MTELTIGTVEVQRLGTAMLKAVVSVFEKENIPYFMSYGSLLGTVRHSGPIPWDYDIDLSVPESEVDRAVEAVERNLNDQYWVDYRNKDYTLKPFPRIGLKGYDTRILHVDVFRLSGLPGKGLEQKIMMTRGRILWLLWKAKTINPNIYYSKNKTKRIIATGLKCLVLPVSVSQIINTYDRLSKKYDVFSTECIAEINEPSSVHNTELFESYIMMPYSDFSVRVPSGYKTILKNLYGEYMNFPPEEERIKGEKAIWHIKPAFHNNTF